MLTARAALRGILIAAGFPAILIGACTDRGDPVVSAAGDCAYTVTAPAGGSVEVGQTLDIAWTSEAGGGQVDLLLLKGGVQVGVVAESEADDGAHAWVVEDFGAGEGADYRLRVQDAADAACGAESAAFAIGALVIPVSFGGEIQPIFDMHCIGCHGASGGLALDEGASYGNLVNVTSLSWGPRKRVLPGDPQESVLYLKLIGDPSTGGTAGQMPQGGALETGDIDLVERWIAEGALDN